jgi:hypothetical protein
MLGWLRRDKDGTSSAEGERIKLDPSLGINRFGLTEVYAKENAIVDIVFVHGLGGGPQKTWTASNGTFWPSKVLTQGIDNVRILTYGYNGDPTFFSNKASGDNVMDHAHTLIAHLHALRNNKASPRGTTVTLDLLTLITLAQSDDRTTNYIRLPFTWRYRCKAGIDILGGMLSHSESRASQRNICFNLWPSLSWNSSSRIR